MKNLLKRTKRTFFLLVFAMLIRNISFAQITLPIEVLSPSINSYTVPVDFVLKEDASEADRIFLKVHRPVYRDVSVNPQRGAKMSIRLNEGPWIDITNDNVSCFAQEKSFGGLNGAYHTVRMTVPISNAVSGMNTLRFRYNGTDGLTTGFRVLRFNVRNGRNNLIPASEFVEDNPSNWKPIFNDAKRIAEGKSLWLSKQLIESPLSDNKLKANCASCHASDGRDLKYFNYSDESIIKRSQFHELTKGEGKRIASYIRSLTSPAPKKGRPWNPPYQPGPGLDSKPVAEWSAGAGLGAVLAKDEKLVNEVFNGVVNTENVKQVLDIEKTQNARETRLPIQLPDWNEWLTHTHPLDVPEIGEKFLNVPVHKVNDKREPIYTTYLNTVKELRNSDINEIAKNGKLKTILNNLANQTTNLSSLLSQAYGYSSDTKERINENIMKWGAVKTWEIMKVSQLEDKAPLIYGEYGEARSWLSLRRNVFEIAPHRSANNNSNFAYQDVLVGKFFSTSWYHLQLIINGGNRDTGTLWPVDWNYQPNHIVGLHTAGDGPKQPYRYVISHAKMFQQFNDKKEFSKSGINIRQIHPGRYIPNLRDKYIFDDLSFDTQVTLYEGLLNATMDLIDSYSIAEWREGSKSNNLLPDEIPKIVAPNKYVYELHILNYPDTWYTMIPYFRQAGVNEKTLNRLIDWGEQIWPKGDWKTLRASSIQVSGSLKPFSTYGGYQDNGTATIFEAGNEVFLEDNAWKDASIDYNITANTRLEFDFKSTEKGELHGIGFDTNEEFKPNDDRNNFFQLYGSDINFNQDFNTYEGDGEWKSYSIPIGTYFTGRFTKLVLVSDEDRSQKFTNSSFRNIRIVVDNSPHKENLLISFANDKNSRTL